MQSSEIRQRFLDYFRQRGHTIVPSSSLVPEDDPTLLFVNAGMVQFKNVFLGREQRPYRRATSSQKCLRAGGKHNDLENVGPSPRHHTFFEMLGNFSFGDYFKREAIGFAWEFLTAELGLPRERLWATVFQTDDEAAALWQEISGLEPARIVRLGEKDNFWSMGDTGPCGPCSEIHYDRGARYGCGQPDCNPGHDCGRFWEIWNLVFMQLDQDEHGHRSPLPRPSIDTGMGLERITAVLQGVESNYETDLFRPIMERTRELLGEGPEHLLAHLDSYRVVADHTRAVSFLIGDGVLPASEGRGYVLRRILRRAIRHGRKLGFERPFLGETAAVVVRLMGDVYPEIVQRQDFIARVLEREEENFQRTLTAGLNRFDTIVDEVRQAGWSEIPGVEVFRLYDTYGFPLDLTEELARELDLTLDAAGFEEAMERQRRASQAGAQFGAIRGVSTEAYQPFAATPTLFLGYATTETDASVLGLLQDGTPVPEATTGEAVEVVLDRTPFYVESGGQVSDTGRLEGPDGVVEIERMARPLPTVTVHLGRVISGRLRAGDQVQARVDLERRLDTARNHTATHLLHKVLKDVLGSHVQQAGSLVGPEGFRFDFNHPQAVSESQRLLIESELNDRIRENLPVQTTVMGYQQALETGAVAIFEEKYGDQVRVVEVDSFSRELCGGTHVRATGEIGLFHIVREGSIGSGLRRLEAVTGHGAEQYLRARARVLEEAAERLSVPAEAVAQQVASLSERLRERDRTIAALRRELAGRDLETLLGRVQALDGVSVLATRAEVPDAASLREMGDDLRNRMGSGVIVLGAAIAGKPRFVAMVTPDLVQRGLNAGRIVKDVAALAGGGGGGRPELAEAGGRDPDQLDAALAAVPRIVKQAL